MPEASVSIEQDHFPQVADKASRRVEMLGLKDKLGNSQARREFFGAASNEQYKKMLGYVNSVTRRQPIKYDYQNGQLPSEDAPPFEDKAPLMDLTFETVRHILSDGGLDDRSALRRAGLTLAGALNYTHPYENGNGRTGRAMHYLVEFGTERGDQAFNQELYAILGKTKVYDTDKAKAIYDTPPMELRHALGVVSNSVNGSEQSTATERVKVFLQMMQGQVTVPIQKEVNLKDLNSGTKETIPAGQIDGRTLYLREYLDHSSIPFRSPNELPHEARRVLAQKPEVVSSSPINLGNFLDLVE